MTFNHGCLGEYHVPWVDQSLYSPHRKSSIVYCSMDGKPKCS